MCTPLTEYDHLQIIPICAGEPRNPLGPNPLSTSKGVVIVQSISHIHDLATPEIKRSKQYAVGRPRCLSSPPRATRQFVHLYITKCEQLREKISMDRRTDYELAVGIH